MGGRWPVGIGGCIRACNLTTFASIPSPFLSSLRSYPLVFPSQTKLRRLATYFSLSNTEYASEVFASAVWCRSSTKNLGRNCSKGKIVVGRRFICSAQEKPPNSGRRVTGPIVLKPKQSVAPSISSFADGAIGFKQTGDDRFDDSGEKRLPDLIFLGTGTSEGVPRVSCLTNHSKHCAVCWAATQPGDRNRRRNTSVIVRYPHADGRTRHILIDAGKFFYHSALQWFPYFGIRQLDAVIITHSHADAIGGLDDLRDWTNNVQEDIPIYVTERDLEVMKKTHYYLVDSSGITKGTAVSKLQFKLITEEPFLVHGLKVTPLPVWHGPGYRSLGFRIGDLCYISDVSEIPPETYPLLENCNVLVMDALRPDRSSSTHFGLPAALEEVRKIRPKKTLFTGMMHTTDHNAINAQLAPFLEKEGLDMELSYDGMRVGFNPES